MRNLLLLLLLTIISTTLYSQNDSIRSLTKSQRVYNLSLIWQEVNYNYAYLDYKISKSEWDSIYLATIPRVINTNNSYDYYRELKRFVGNLHDGHTALIPPKNANSNLGVVSLIIRYVNNDFYIIGVGDEYKGKIVLGDKITKINGINTKTYFDNEIYPFESNALHSRYRYLDYKLLAGNVNDTLIATLRGIDDVEPRRVVLKRHSSYGTFYTHASYHRIKSYSFSVLKKDIAYVNIGSFADNSILKKFENDIDSMQKCSTIIIDVRGNGGGSSFGDQICKYFTNDTIFESYSMETRVNNAYYKALGAYSSNKVAEILKSTPSYFNYRDYFLNNKYESKKWFTSSENDSLRGVLSKKKLLILTDQKTFSAAETFVLTFRILNIGTVIGQPTAGSSTQPLIIPLLGGGHVRIATQRTLRIDGSIYDFIKPDIVVIPVIEDYLKGYDRILNKAIMHIEK